MPFSMRLWTRFFIGTFVICISTAYGIDISGTITTTLTITENSRLVGDVSCTVTGAPCIAFGASNLILDLNGFSMTGLGDPITGCMGNGTAGEFGIDVNAVSNAVIRGLGLVQQFRNFGIRLNNSMGATVSGVTMSTNCFSGIILIGGSGHLLENNVSVRNGNPANPCGGIWLAGGASANRLRGNRLSGNGYTAQGTNFGIGLVTATNTANIIESNTILGNTNGIFIAAGVQGNVFRGNLVTGNPPVQIAIDHTSATAGFDILNLSMPGANLFQGNRCVTSMNAPCPSVGPSLTANPNPIPVTGTASLGSTTLSWTAPDSEAVEVHIGSPDGKLFAEGGGRGSMPTGVWVPDGMTFYLQDVSEGKPLTSDNTLATVVVHLQKM